MSCRFSLTSRKGFTLIELLIVISIILVLVAIALPNFLEVQTRAKVTKSRADMRSLASAIETYRLDWREYPLPAAVMAADLSVVYPMPSPMHAMYATNFMAGPMTSPNPYIQDLLPDPFAPEELTPSPEMQYYYYMSFDYTWELAAGPLTLPMGHRADAFGAWVMFACGPDGDRKDMAPDQVGATGTLLAVYNATNGTASNGDLVFTQRSPRGPTK